MTISRVEGIAMMNTKTPVYLEVAKRLFLLFVAALALNAASARAEGPANQTFSEQLGEVSRLTKDYVTELVNIYKDIHSHPK